MKSTIAALMGATTLLTMAVAMPEKASAQTTPAFRVPLGSAPTSSTVDASYSWLQQVGSCSSTCGPGTRTTTYQCQNVADYDFSGSGYGLPEPDAMCNASSGPRPADFGSPCTVYSGCGYDWVKPPVAQTPVAINPYPVGRVGCGKVNQRFSPYCQRTGGGTNVILSAGDYRFCSSDRPDYDEVASGNADALGYNRDVTQVSSCNTTDHKWTQSGFGSWSSDCSTNAVRTQTVTCERKFDGQTYPSSAAEDAACGAASRPASSETAARYGSCSYRYDYGAWSAWSSGCDTNATRSRSASCIRSNDGGQVVPDSSCTAAGVAKAAVSETSPQYGSCTYEFRSAAWSAYNSSCSNSATRTRDVWCQRSNGDRVADTECTNRGQAKPGTSESAPQYGSCTYSWAQGGFGAWSSSCSNSATRTQSVWCRRDLDGATVADSSCNAAARPPASQTSGQYAGCSYSPGGSVSGWSGWSSGCSASATRTRQYQCVRNNDGGQIVADGECTGRGVGLTESQTSANYASCSYHLEDAGVGACNGTNRPHYWRCVRDLDGAQVDSSTFCGRPNPTYDSCTYTYSLRDAGVGACQTNNQAPHYWGCVRNETGEQVDSATYCGRSNPTYEACQYPWTYRLEDAGVGACNGTNRSHYWRCVRNEDGAQVDSAAYCGRPNPTYDSCTYTYTLGDGGVGACQTNNQAPHYWNCRRNETGEMVDSGTYCGRANPTYDACSYPWTYTAVNWGGYGTCTNGSQTRTAQCQRGDGTIVGNDVCNARGVSTTQSQSCSSKPTFCAMSPRYKLTRAGSARDEFVETQTSEDGSFWFNNPAALNNGNDNPCGRTLTGSSTIVSNGVAQTVSASCSPGGGPACDSGDKTYIIDGVVYYSRVYVSSYQYAARVCQYKVELKASYNSAWETIPKC